MTSKLTLGLLAAMLAFVALAPAAQAQRYRRGYDHHRFHHRPFHRYDRRHHHR